MHATLAQPADQPQSLLQRIQRLKFLLVSELRHELHTKALSVEITVKIKQVHFEVGERAIVHCRSDTDVATPGALLSPPGHSHRINTVKRRLYTLKRNIGGWRADSSSQLLTFEYFSRKFERFTQ